MMGEGLPEGAVTPVPIAPFYLVVAAPHDQAGVVGHISHRPGRLLPYFVQEVGIVSRVLGARKQEIMPDHDAGFVACVAEILCGERAATPDAKRVETGFRCTGYKTPVTFLCDGAIQQVSRGPVASLADDGAVVDL